MNWENRTSTKVNRTADQFSDFVYQMIDGAAILDPSGMIVYANKAFSDFLEEGTFHDHSSLIDLLDEASRTKVSDEFEKVIKGEACEFTVTFKGTKRIIQIKATPRFNQSGVIAQTFIIARDVTEKIDLEQRLHQYRKDLERLVSERTAKMLQSEGKYRLIIENINDTVFILDKSGKFTFISQNCSKLCGNTDEAIMGQEMPLKAHIHPDDYGWLWSMMNNTAEYGIGGVDQECRILHKNGYQIWVSISWNVLRNRNDEIIGFVGSEHDINDRKIFETQLWIYACALESITENVFILSPLGQILFANEAAGRLLLCAGDEFAERPFQSFFDSVQETLLPENFFEVLANEEWQGELQVKTKTGEKKLLSLSTSPIRSQQKDNFAVVVIARDITTDRIQEYHRNLLFTISHLSQQYADLLSFTSTVCQEIIKTSYYTSAMLYYYDPDTRKVELLGSAGTQLKLDVQFPEYTQEDFCRFEDSIALPITHEGLLIGFLRVVINGDTVSPETSLSMLWALLHEFAIILNQKVLSERIAQRTKELNILNELSTDISGTLVPERLYEKIFHLLKELFHIDIFFIQFVPPDKSSSWGLYIDSREGDQRIIQTPQLSKGFQQKIQQVLNTRKPQVEESLLLSQELEIVRKTSDNNMHECSLMIVPMIFDKKDVIGVLCIQRCNKDSFTQNDVNFLQSIANHITIAAKNAQLVDQMGRSLQRQRTILHELQHRNEELKVQHEEAARANRIKSEFLATMSHELRTPLNAVIGFSDILMSDIHEMSPQMVDELLKNINLSGKNLLQIINNVLDLSKIESGKMELHLSMCSVDSIMDDVTRVMMPIAKERSITIRKDIAVTRDSFVADEQRIKQVLFNLLSNAVKFSHDNSEVIIHITNDNSDITFSIEDHGIGIKREDQGHLFRSFRQLDNTYSRKYQGTGLGLVLSKQFVELHGGSIGFISYQGRGSTFSFAIPLKTNLN